MIYTIAPDFNLRSKYVNRGGIFATFGIIIATAIYSYYINHIARYDIFYGSLSNIVILLIFCYFISYIIVLGIAINNSYYVIEKSSNNKQ